jgi:endothelin-converting enzyme/putative endopeptidase
MRLRQLTGAAVFAAGVSIFTAPAAPAAAAPAKGAPDKIPGFDPSALDRAADPCTDFFQFACGGWMASNPIPPDQSRWGRFDELSERNRATLRDILEAAAKEGPERSAVERRIGDHYAACMDEAVVDKAGAGPLQPVLERIAALRSKAELPALLARIHTNGGRALFGFGSFQDFKDATMNIAAVDQGGLGLPDRDYYVKDDPRSVELRRKYREHVARMFGLLGDAPAAAAAQADRVLALETVLAKNSMERVKRRDPDNIYNKTTTAALAALAPSFDWSRYFAAAGAPAFGELNLVSKPFFEGFEAFLAGADLADLKTYLRWHALNDAAPTLSSAFVNENFDFFGRSLAGAKELRPRWKRCVQATDADLGEALGQIYVARTFGADGKARMLKMVDALERALARDIETLPWMTAATRAKALDKLHAITNKIGYPDTWRDYGSVDVRRDDPFGNRERAAAFEWARDMAKIGHKVDPKEWRMTPPTVNAYYEPSNNSINFPAGILQPPFFDRQADDAVNFGGVGAVIGHELTHGFDDQGRRFAGDGNLKDWWTEEDGKEFEKRAQCFVDQYAGYAAVDDVKLDGQLTLGENVADNGGLRIAAMALAQTLGTTRPAPIDGFTAEQRLFLGWGQVWCQNVTPETARLRAQTDPHSPGRFRVNGVVSNMPEFQSAFNCPAGKPMVRGDAACRVW